MARCKAWTLMLVVALAVLPLSAGAQPPKKIAVFPAIGAHLNTTEGWAVADYFLQQLAEDDRYAILDEAAVRAYMDSLGSVAAPDLAMLNRAALWLSVDEIILPALTISGDTLELRATLYERETQQLARTASMACACLVSSRASFPIQEVLDKLLGPAGIILGASLGEPALPPPPPPITLPAPPAPADSSAAKPQSGVPAAGRSAPWGRYAAGVALVSGGILYIVTRGKASPAGEQQKLPDPPAPPNQE